MLFCQCAQEEMRRGRGNDVSGGADVLFFFSAVKWFFQHVDFDSLLAPENLMSCNVFVSRAW